MNWIDRWSFQVAASKDGHVPWGMMHDYPCWLCEFFCMELRAVSVTVTAPISWPLMTVAQFFNEVVCDWKSCDRLNLPVNGPLVKINLNHVFSRYTVLGLVEKLLSYFRQQIWTHINNHPLAVMGKSHWERYALRDHLWNPHEACYGTVLRGSLS